MEISPKRCHAYGSDFKKSGLCTGSESPGWSEVLIYFYDDGFGGGALPSGNPRLSLWKLT